jgi:hypothetical protein
MVKFLQHPLQSDDQVGRNSFRNPGRLATDEAKQHAQHRGHLTMFKHALTFQVEKINP